MIEAATSFAVRGGLLDDVDDGTDDYTKFLVGIMTVGGTSTQLDSRLYRSLLDEDVDGEAELFEITLTVVPLEDTGGLLL